MRKIIFITMLLVCSEAFAQFNIDFLKSSNQQMVEEAVGDGLILLRQEYQLEDTLTRKRYSLDGKPEFGSVLSFAVKTDDGIVVSKNILTPWDKDANFAQYAGSKYRPVLTRTLMRSVRNKEWTPVDSLDFADFCCIADESWVKVPSKCSEGFQQDTLYGEKDGWVIWLTSVGEDPATADLSLISYKNRQSTDKSVKVMEIGPANTENTLLGGVYLTPDFSHIGQITLLMNGVVVKGSQGWNLVLTDDCEVREKPESLTPTQGKVAELTAVPDTEEDTVSDTEEEKDEMESDKKKIKKGKK